MRPKRFWLPEGRPFEIPVEWWTEAGMDRFYLGPDVSYRGRPHLNSKVVLMADIELPSMEHRKLSHGPLDRDRMSACFGQLPSAQRSVLPQSQR
jgi:hypothetical protein